MEAATYGKPLLDSKYDGGAREFVYPGENGFIFDPRSTHELAQMMSKFISQPELLGKFGLKSKAIIQIRQSWLTRRRTVQSR
jgi:glycosyltransferase involved in cell wall biosynthesis